MSDPNFYLVMATAMLAGIGMITAAGLAGWRGWLSLKRQELSLTHQSETSHAAPTNAGARIEIADLKERIRKLEAIAAGVDL
ncbi:hypothetical protein FPZ54_03080 [Sphingomonas suaedae]|uniref:Uncharacterized protein n=1 Tax=Sphingomonas suaedae TaxID=2599297 RepID=A0A518RCG0_9SPHN|nr:hypothetical protein [Sphingomonas suaedae]QDX25104.1 hypothetical protein FPZ54_03080 [Sphingomonas suaedae]